MRSERSQSYDVSPPSAWRTVRQWDLIASATHARRVTATEITTIGLLMRNPGGSVALATSINCFSLVSLGWGHQYATRASMMRPIGAPSTSAAVAVVRSQLPTGVGTELRMVSNGVPESQLTGSKERMLMGGGG